MSISRPHYRESKSARSQTVSRTANSARKRRIELKRSVAIRWMCAYARNLIFTWDDWTHFKAYLLRIMKAHIRYTNPINCEAQHVHMAHRPRGVGMRRSHQDRETSRFARRDSDMEDSDSRMEHRLGLYNIWHSFTHAWQDSDSLPHGLRHNTTLSQGCSYSSRGTGWLYNGCTTYQYTAPLSSSLRVMTQGALAR